MPRSKPDKSRSRGKASAKAAKPNPSPVRKKPLLDLCRGAGWAPQHLDQAAATDQELTALLIKELVACREAGKLDLTLALCDAAKARGLVHPRIATIRERAKRSQQHPVAKPKGSSGAGRAAPRKLTILQRLGLALGLRSSGSKSGVKRPKPGPERQAQAQGSKPKPEPSPAAGRVPSRGVKAEARLPCSESEQVE